LFPLFINAQDNRFLIRGITQKADVKKQSLIMSPRATITLFKDGVQSAEKKSNEKGEFEFANLEYDHIYKLVFSVKGCIEMFMLVDANIPLKSRSVGIEHNYIFYETADVGADKEKFKYYPFLKAGLVGKRFAVDEKYRDEFAKGIIPEDMKAAVEKIKAEEKNKEKLTAELLEKQKREAAEALALESKKIKIAGKLFAYNNSVGADHDFKDFDKSSVSHSKPLANVVLRLVNEKGEEVQTITTNFLGAFVFYILPDKTYEFSGDGAGKVQSNAKIVFTNKNDKEIQNTTADAKGSFKFKLLAGNSEVLASITVIDADLKMDLKGKILSGDTPANAPLSEIKINLVGSISEPTQSTKTDKEGRFAFTYLSSSQNYTIAIDENNSQLTSTKKIILTDEKGVVIKEVAGNKLSDFKFEILPFEKNKMSTLYVDDPWLKIANLSGTASTKPYEEVITERVYFNVNDDKLLPDAQKTLDKVVAVLAANAGVSIVLSSHTDSQGGDDYNLKLSERRAKAAVDYMVASGIDAAGVTGKGYGETHLLNKCANNIKCTEEEHAKNRRLEFKVIKK